MIVNLRTSVAVTREHIFSNMPLSWPLSHNVAKVAIEESILADTTTTLLTMILSPPQMLPNILPIDRQIACASLLEHYVTFK